MEIVNVMSFTKMERDAYEGRLKWLRAEASALKKFGHKNYEKGVEDGREEGGKSKAMEIACSMLAAGMDITTIVKITGLSTAEVDKLKDALVK